MLVKPASYYYPRYCTLAIVTDRFFFFFPIIHKVRQSMFDVIIDVILCSGL